MEEDGKYVIVDGEKVIHPIGEPDSFVYKDSEETTNYAEYKIIEVIFVNIGLLMSILYNYSGRENMFINMLMK